MGDTVRVAVLYGFGINCDHRIIDGADGARFLRWVCEALENPFKLLVES